MANKKAKFEPVRNEAYHQAMVDIRRSSAASKHVLASRKGTRKMNDARAIRDSRV